MKNNIDYYKHDVNSHNHNKFKMLRVKYGWEGEGRFWALNNMIASSENCILDLSKKYNKGIISVDLGMDLGEFDEFISYLEKECNLIKKIQRVESRNKQCFTTEMVQEVIKKVSKERLRNKENYGDRVLTESNKNGDKRDEKGIKRVEKQNKRVGQIQSKVKESKVKESIDIKGKKYFHISLIKDFPHLKDKKFEENLNEFVKMRKENKKKMTDYAVKLLLKKLHKQHLLTANFMLEKGIEKCWQGIEYEWLSEGERLELNRQIDLLKPKVVKEEEEFDPVRRGKALDKIKNDPRYKKIGG